MFRHDHNNARVHGGTRWEAERRWRNDHRRDDWDHRRREHHDHFRAHRGWSHDGFIEHHRHRHYGHFRYVPPVVIVAPPIMWSGSRLIAPVGQPQAFLSPDDDRPLWYYCDNPRGYYPQVADCPQGWQAVVPPTGTGY